MVGRSSRAAHARTPSYSTKTATTATTDGARTGAGATELQSGANSRQPRGAVASPAPPGGSASTSTASSSVSHIDDEGDIESEDRDMLDPDDDGAAANDGLDEDMRTAIAALGIMRRGGSSNGSTAPPLTPSQPHQQHFDSSGAPTGTSYTVSNSGGRASSGVGAAASNWAASAAAADSSAHGASSSSSAASTSSSIDHRRGSSSVASSEDTMSDDLCPVGEDGSSSVAPTSAVAVADASSSLTSGAAETGVNDPNFIARVAQLPIVSGGIEWYERSKASSRVVKYGAGLVESSISTIGRPIANNLQLGSLDDFACRQLDRFGPGATSPSTQEMPLPQQQFERVGQTDVEMVRPAATRRATKGSAAEAGAEERQWGESDGAGQGQLQVGTQQAVAEGRSRWQTVLVEAGGIGAAVSEESLKSLRYCLQWLLYATAHLDHQIATLRDFIASLHSHSSRAGASSDALVTASASAHLSQIKHDVVETIRKVVDVVSKYAGVALPEQAKRYVRQSILGLPVKWASAIEGSRGMRAQSVGAQSTASTPRAERMEDPDDAAPSPAATTTTTQAESEARARSAALAPTEDAAERILTFAVESLDMLRSVTGIFSDSVARAEDWIERLRIVGVDRQRQRQQAGTADASMPPPAIDGSATGTKRRRAIARDGEDGEGMSTGVDAHSLDVDEGVVRRKRGPRSRETTMALE